MSQKRKDKNAHTIHRHLEARARPFRPRLCRNMASVSPYTHGNLLCQGVDINSETRLHTSSTKPDCQLLSRASYPKPRHAAHLDTIGLEIHGNTIAKESDVYDVRF
ncbi:hypothetical protein HMPREF1640_11005 [Prevotella sp. S7-1-8]|nr:hypothetical protein HMPREF1640_11005 [Prevotella sp. S7-1-8]